MAIIEENEFTSYKFAPEEVSQASSFTELNIFLIRNLRAAAAISKVNLVNPKMDDENYKLELAYYKGYMDGLDRLLQENDTYKQERSEVIEEAARQNFEPPPQVDLSQLFTQGVTTLVSPLAPINPITPNTPDFNRNTRN